MVEAQNGPVSVTITAQSSRGTLTWVPNEHTAAHIAALSDEVGIESVEEALSADLAHVLEHLSIGVCEASHRRPIRKAFSGPSFVGDASGLVTALAVSSDELLELFFGSRSTVSRGTEHAVDPVVQRRYDDLSDPSSN